MRAPLIVILNGVPRSGKSTLAAEIVTAFEGAWVNLGVDSTLAATPSDLQPGIGLRPGGERPDLEDFVLSSYRELFDQIATAARSGVHVAVDAGLHDGYSRPLNVIGELVTRFEGLPLVWVGVHCSLATLRTRRADTGYLSWGIDDEVPEPVMRWQHAVHRDKHYDVEVNTSASPLRACVAHIRTACTST